MSSMCGIAIKDGSASTGTIVHEVTVGKQYALTARIVTEATCTAAGKTGVSGATIDYYLGTEKIVSGTSDVHGWFFANYTFLPTQVGDKILKAVSGTLSTPLFRVKVNAAKAELPVMWILLLLAVLVLFRKKLGL